VVPGTGQASAREPFPKLASHAKTRKGSPFFFGSQLLRIVGPEGALFDTCVAVLQYRPLIFNDNGRPETIPINRVQPHPSAVLNQGMPGHRGGRGVTHHTGIMQAPYQLMSMMPDQMVHNCDAAQGGVLVPHKAGSDEKEGGSDGDQASPAAETVVTAGCHGQAEQGKKQA
jgi:hypothetical protein